jgi:hypothetical protein
MRHKAVRVSIDGVPLGVALSQIAGVHREKCLLLRLGEPRLGQDRSGDCVDLTARLGGLGVWTGPRREVFQRQRQRLGDRCEHTCMPRSIWLRYAFDTCDIRESSRRDNRESSRWVRI